MRTLARLNSERNRLGISLETIAAEASKTSRRKTKSVSVSTVSNVLSGRRKSANVVETVQRLIAAGSKSLHPEAIA